MEKKTVTQILVRASDFDSALANFKKGMEGTMADYEIASIAETLLMDVFGADLSIKGKVRGYVDSKRDTETPGRTSGGVRLVAVSKFHPAEAVAEAYAAGQRPFGESRVQELLQKIPLCPSDIQWHFIGHLQTNKVRQLMGKTALIESVDSERLLELIDSESARAGVVTRVLMQVHVAREETKFGFWPDELLRVFQGA